MSTPETQPPHARPGPAADRGWLGQTLDLLPVPVVAVDTRAGRVVVKNTAADRVPLSARARIAGDAGPVEPALALGRLLAAGADGIPAGWDTPDGEVRFRVFARALTPADGEAPLAVLTFLDDPGPAATEQELREALQVRDEFFSVATHELKDPLFSIQLSLQLLRHAAEKQGPLPVHLAHHLDVCGRQADRLARLIDNLLDVSRIRGGRFRPDLETLDLAELARETVSRFRETARAAGAALTVDADQQVIGYFDRLKIDQVLSNLLTNALKYGAGKPVTVRVRQAGVAAVVEVEDGGPGVAAADQERIFRRFERASRDHQKGSLGLGLYIVRSIAEAHGGTVTVRSEPGRGATFTVTLPRTRVHHQETPAGSPGADSETHR